MNSGKNAIVIGKPEGKRNMMKKIMWIIFLCAFCSPAWASNEIPTEFQVDETDSEIKDNFGVTSVIDEYLAKKGYSEGKNIEKGRDFFISKGVGAIESPRNHPAYMRSRINAFDKAMMAAKKEMVQYIGIKIRTEATSEYAEGESPEDRRKREAVADAALKEPGIIDKTKSLVNAKLDQLLEKEGVDLSKPIPEQTLNNVLTSETFKKFTETAAQARIVGMQPLRVFEASPDGKKGEIGVVTVYSDKLHKMADALFSGNFANLPKGSPKTPIIQQIPKDKNVLLTMFGVQQKTDENGNLMLVAFGQGVPKTNSPRSTQAAVSKAKMNGLSALRSFAGEIASVREDLSSYESTSEFEKGLEKYKNEEYFHEKIKTTADALNISGCQKIYSWKAHHPLTNHEVVGVVMAWSPSSASHADKIGSKMKTKPKKAEPKSGTLPNTYKTGSNQSGSYSGSGAEADEDSF